MICLIIFLKIFNFLKPKLKIFFKISVILYSSFQPVSPLSSLSFAMNHFVLFAVYLHLGASAADLSMVAGESSGETQSEKNLFVVIYLFGVLNFILAMASFVFSNSRAKMILGVFHAGKVIAWGLALSWAAKQPCQDFSLLLSLEVGIDAFWIAMGISELKVTQWVLAKCNEVNPEDHEDREEVEGLYRGLESV